MPEIENRLRELGLTLPTPAAPVANYVPTTQTGSLLFVSGQLPLGLDGKLASAHSGKLTISSSIESAREAARLSAINVIAQAKSALGDLDRVTKVVRLGGFFAVDDQFNSLPLAMNGASDLFAEVFGARGRHARTTVGVAFLPLNALCEVEAIFEIAV